MKKTQINLSFEENSGYILRKIYGKTRNHSDGINYNEIFKDNVFYIKNNNLNDIINAPIRNSSVIFTLNNNYDGGNFRFPYQDISIKLKLSKSVIKSIFKNGGRYFSRFLLRRTGTLANIIK